MIDHLQSGFEGIQLQSAAEHPNFNGIRVRKVDCCVAPSAGIFRVAHLFGRRKADAIPRRPAVHLALRAAAEPQQFSPELFDEVEQARNRGLLLFIGTAKRQAGNMNMQATGPGGVAEIVHFPVPCGAPPPTAFRSADIRAS